MTRLGILGGTFNPPHIGHLVCGQEAHAQLELDRVVLMPVAEPPHKEAEEDPGAEHRVEMCRRAVAGDERFEVSKLEVERGGASYTVATLEALREQRPDDELVWIAGGDMAASLQSWRDPERVLELARFAVAERGEGGPPAIREAVAELRGAERIEFFEMPRIEVASSLIRARVAEGRPVRYLVPDPVADYIAQRGLYGAVVSA